MDDQITEIIGWSGFALVSMGYYFNAKRSDWKNKKYLELTIKFKK